MTMQVMFDRLVTKFKRGNAPVMKASSKLMDVAHREAMEEA